VPYRYLILDSRSTPLARGHLETPPDAAVWQVRVLDQAVENVLNHEYLQLVSMTDHAPAKMGRLLRQHEDIISIEPIEDLDDEVLQNLRVLVKFSTYIYPLSGTWKGRIPVISHDLSCRGLSFYCSFPLEVGEVLEVVVPITDHPLILRAKVLRQRPSNSQIPLFSAHFVDLVSGEESMVREAVFGQQIQNKNQAE
jgi:hypothetical protein